MQIEAIDLGVLTEGKVHNLSGHERGLAARDLFKLDALDRDGVRHTIRVPDDLYGISPSFVQGLFTASLRSLDNDLDAFKQSYTIEASDLIQRQIDRGLQNILMDRKAPL
ncbi:hypothetical protein [Qipengyuania sp. DGS5-3]|uniref:hypothetical protein n=1 Tax=Qipengyuania sp. DGS5-3 TaxID=3349632 RepID=UPI0036D37AC3